MSQQINVTSSMNADVSVESSNTTQLVVTGSQNTVAVTIEPASNINVSMSRAVIDGAGTRIEVQDEGTNVVSTTTINFSGSGVTVSNVGNVAEVNILGLTGVTWANVSDKSGANGPDYISIGQNAGGYPGGSTVSLGIMAGNLNQGGSAVAIGPSAGRDNQGPAAIAIGSAGVIDQGGSAIAIGSGAGQVFQKPNSIAIGEGAGLNTLGNNSIAIGYQAGTSTTYAQTQGNNSIILNATGANLVNQTANTFTVKPVRNANTANVMFYNNSTGEISYDLASNVVVANANYAAYAGNIVTNAQPNITSVGILTSLVVDGNITPNSNIAYSLGNNTNRFNDLYLSGNTIYLGPQEISANANSIIFSGNIDATNNVTALKFYAATGGDEYSGYGFVGATNNNTAMCLTATDEITIYNNAVQTLQLFANNNSKFYANVEANLFIGDGGSLSNITGANVVGDVGGANHANVADSANSVAGANVSGEVANANYATYSGTAYSVSGANVSGEVANANYATYAGTAYSVDVANVSGIGNIAVINLDGNASNLLDGTGNWVAIPTVSSNANYANFAGQVVDATQSNITSVGTLTDLSVTGNITSFANITGDYFLGNGAFLTGVGNFSAALGYHGSFFSNVTQTIASTTTAYPITLNNTSPGTYGVSVASNSRVTFTYAGTYNIQYSVQFTNTDNSIHNATIWLRKNGTDVPDTNSVFAVPARHGSTINGQLIGAINYIEDVGANDYYELIWQAESTSVSLEYIPPGTTPTSPAAPSAIVTAMQVTNVQAATLSGNLTGDLIGNTYGLTGTSFVNIIGNISGNVFTGNGSGLTNLNGANVTGQVANALVAGTVYTNAQPNITSLGNLPYLQVSNNANADGVIRQTSSGNIAFTTGSGNTTTWQLTTQYHPNNSTNYPGDRYLRLRGNVTNPTTAVAGDRILGRVGYVYNGTNNGIAVSETWVATPISANANVVWQGGTWNMVTGNPQGDTGNSTATSTQNLLTFTNSGQLQILQGTAPNVSLGQAQSSLLITNYGGSSANLVPAGGINFQRARGNRDANASVQPGDQIGRSVFIPYSNGSFQSGNTAVYRVVVDSTYVANDTIVPMSHQFVTMANVANVATSRVTSFYANGLADLPGNLNVAGTSNLGAVGNVIITGGTANYVLSTNGSGNLSWVAQSGGGGTPGGANTELQFNNNGAFGGISNVTWNGANISLGAVANVKITGGSNNEVMRTDGTGNLSFSSIAETLLVGTRAGPYTVPITNYTFQVTARTGNVTVYVN